jgi:uncharacterized protein (TIGR02646 family)
VIRIAKSAVVPGSLARGVPLTQANCDAYDAEPDAYRDGRKRFTFNKAIYGAAAVKNALKRDQHDKCCFCEGVSDAYVAGDVEHYRPKGAAVTTGGLRVLPGYFWLAYDWTNLYYACPDCNQYRKRDQFPLANEANRARDQHGNLAAENPMLLDPGGGRDPRDHIEFVGATPRWRSDEGKATIKLLKLDRIKLTLERRRHLAHLQGLHESARLLADDDRPDAIALVASARAELDAAIRSNALFSAAAQDFIAAMDAGSAPAL